MGLNGFIFKKINETNKLFLGFKRLQKDFSPISTRFVGENVIEFYPFRQRFPSIYPPTRMRLDSANKLGFKNGYKLIFLNASIIILAAS